MKNCAFILTVWGLSQAVPLARCEDAPSTTARQPTVTAVSAEIEKSLFDSKNKGLVLIFISTECPIANRYAPEIQRLWQEFGPQGFDFRLVYPNQDETAVAARKHLADFKYQIPALIDHEHVLVKCTGVHTLPESAVFVAGQGWVYHGRIDDRDSDFGKTRPQAGKRDLHEVLEAIVGGQKVAPHSTIAIGCTIPPVP